MKSIRISSIQKGSAPDDASKARLSFTLEVESDESGEIETTSTELWFDTDAEFGDYFCDDRCDAVVVQLTVPMMLFGFTSIESDYPISQKLWYNLTYHVLPQLEVMNGKRTSAFDIKMPLTDEAYPCEGVGTGMSRGVDSFATFYEYHNFPLKKYNLTHLTYFNVGAHHGQGVKGRSITERYYGQLNGTKDFCNEFNYPLIVLDSNFVLVNRELFGRYSFDRAHTYRNLGCVLLFQKLFSLYHYSPAYNLDEFEAKLNIDCAHYEKWLIPLLSTESTEFCNSNRNWSRMEKTAFFANQKGAQDHLLVCFAEDTNCGKCEKCRRTLMQLDALGNGLLDKFAKSFDLDEYYANDRKAWFDDIDNLMEGKMMPAAYRDALHYALENNPELVAGSKHVTIFEKPKNLSVKATTLRIRKHPNISSDCIGSIVKGTTFESSLKCGNWFRHEGSDGKRGWVYAPNLVDLDKQKGTTEP